MLGKSPQERISLLLFGGTCLGALQSLHLCP